MKKAGNKGNTNVYMVFTNYEGKIIEEHLIATFRNEKWALEFLKAANGNGNYGDHNYLDMRTV